MQLFEVRNDIAKILYSPAENHLLPSDFLLIEDVNQKLIAQIINISTTENSNNNLADVRLALSIDKDDNLSYYNGYIPSKNSAVVYINPDEIIELLKGNDENIYFGNLSNHPDCFSKLSMSFVNDKVYIQSDRDDKTKTILQNIISELYSKQKKVILMDFDGRFNSIVNVPRLKISESFKLPLNVEAFNNILDYDTVDCPLEDKAVIQSIVLELREYIKTVENNFLPFTLFKNVIDNEFMANPISGLMLLRNKLWLYAQESIFAEAKSQFDFINTILDKQNLLIIDASCLEEKWYKFAIQTVLSLVNKHCYFALSLNDVPMDKKSIINLYNKQGIIPIVSTTYDSNYRQILKSVCKNQILFKPSAVQKDEEQYNVLLNKINSGEFILFGESTLYLPLILELQAFDSSTKEEVIQNDIKKDVDKLFTSSKKLIQIDSDKNGNTPKSIPAKSQEKPGIDTDKNTEKNDNIDNTAAKEKSENIKNTVDNEEKNELLNSLFDNDFNESDLDFLDEQNQEQITIEDLRNKQQRLEKNQKEEEEKYNVFSPMNELDEIYLSSHKENNELINNKTNEIRQVENQNNKEVIEEEEEEEKKTENIESCLLNNILPMGATPPDYKQHASQITSKVISTSKEIKNETLIKADTDDGIKKDKTASFNNETTDKKEQIDASNSSNEIQIDKILENIDVVPVETEITDKKEQIDTSNSSNEIQIDKILENVEVVPTETEITDKKEQIDASNYPDEDVIDIDLEEDEEDDTVPAEIKTDTKENTVIDDVINNITSKIEKNENNTDKIHEEETIEIELEQEETPQDTAETPPVNKNINTRTSPELTVYETDNSSKISKNDVPYEVGDKVSHPKYGEGVIVGFASYSNKIMFCQIEFKNFGKRILDPRITKLEKIS